MKKIKAQRKIDAIGLMCPVPISQTAELIKEMKIGEVVEVIADDEGIKEDMPEWCKNSGNEFLGIEVEDGVLYHVYVRKSS